MIMIFDIPTIFSTFSPSRLRIVGGGENSVFFGDTILDLVSDLTTSLDHH